MERLDGRSFWCVKPIRWSFGSYFEGVRVSLTPEDPSPEGPSGSVKSVCDVDSRCFRSARHVKKKRKSIKYVGFASRSRDQLLAGRVVAALASVKKHIFCQKTFSFFWARKKARIRIVSGRRLRRFWRRRARNSMRLISCFTKHAQIEMRPCL